MSHFSPTSEEAHQIIMACQHLKKAGYLAAADGNISTRQHQDQILITPRSRNKEFITSKDLAVLTLDGKPLHGEPSTESLVHLKIYQQCSKAKWIIHAHPPYAIAWSITQHVTQELPLNALPEVILGVGHVPIVPYALPGEAHLAEAIMSAAVSHKAMIMERHGVIAWGESWEEALNGIERIEHAAKVLALAAMMGGYTTLPDEEIDQIRKKRMANTKQLTL